MEIIVQEVKVTRNYQITIPKVIAEKLGIKIGDKVIVIYENGDIKIRPKNISIKSLKGIIKESKIKSNEIGDILKKSEDEVAEKLIKEYR